MIVGDAIGAAHLCVRFREEFGDSETSLTEAIRGNLIARKWITNEARPVGVRASCQRVVNDDKIAVSIKRLREVPLSFQVCRENQRPVCRASISVVFS